MENNLIDKHHETDIELSLYNFTQTEFTQMQKLDIQ